PLPDHLRVSGRRGGNMTGPRGSWRAGGRRDRRRGEGAAAPVTGPSRAAPVRTLSPAQEDLSMAPVPRPSAAPPEDLNPFRMAARQFDRAVGYLPGLRHGLLEFLRRPARAIAVEFPIDVADASVL